MQYHLFTFIKADPDTRWIMFLYKDDDTCVQTWNYNSRYGIEVNHKDTTGIPIEKRIFILSTTQNGTFKNVWDHTELPEEDALAMFLDVGL